MTHFATRHNPHDDVLNHSQRRPNCWTHNPYQTAARIEVVRSEFLRRFNLHHVDNLRSWSPPESHGPLVHKIVGQVSPFTSADTLAAMFERHAGVRVCQVRETQGRFLVRLHHPAIPQLVCRHGKWRETPQGFELLIDRPEFSAMTAATLKGFIEEKLGQVFQGNIVYKKTRMVYVAVHRRDEQRLALLNGRVLQDRDGHYFVANSDEEAEEMHGRLRWEQERLRQEQQQSQEPGLMSNERRRANELRKLCVPQLPMTIDTPQHIPH